MDAIDLTKSDSDEEVRPVKRQRRSLPDDDVQVIEKPATQAPAAACPEPTLGDEDLLITRATGPVWNEDLPHSRSQCGKHTFLTLASTRNREHCSKCFCYICDVEADKCKQWGSGSSSSDHCNAHGGRQLYQDMRTRARASPAIATPALNVARLGMPVWHNAVQRVRDSAPSSAAGPSAPATSERRQSSGPAGSVRPSATETHLRASSGASRTALHSRTDCPEHPFRPSPSTANLHSCEMCLCFVCGDSALLCEHWGSGEERVDHCNAHAGEERYRLQREAYRQHPSGTNPLPCFNSSAEEHEEDYSDSEGLRDISAARVAYIHKLSGGLASPRGERLPRPKQPMQPVERSSVLPDPALDRNLLEIGTIHLPIKAKAPYTVADLQQRLVPTGIGSRLHHEHSHLTRVSIHNILFNEMLEVLPLQLEQGCEPTPMRVRRVTIVSHDGRAKPLTIGVNVHKEAEMAEVVAALKTTQAASCNPEEELVMAYCAGEKEPFTKALCIHGMSTKTTEYQAKNGYVAFRVPCVKPATEDSKGGNIPSRLVVYNSRLNPEGGFPEWVETAHTILLDLSGDLWKGGRDAEKQVAAMIATGLAPYRKANAHPRAPHECFSLHRCTQSGYIRHGSMRDFSKTVQAPQELAVNHNDCVSSGVMHLAAHWKPQGLDLYDIESWSQPDVHDSASAEIMAETDRRIEEDEAAKKEKKSREQLPKNLLSELSRSCRTYLPDQLKLAKRSHQTLRPPTAACKLDILPEEEAAEECAILQIKVFIWQTRGAFNREFFQSATDWVPANAKERRSVEYTHCLKEVMEYLLKDNPGAKAMCEELKACSQKMRGGYPYSVTALMKWLQAEERPEAPQPPGLTVELHPYQRQSLRFMIDNEQGEGGHRRHFWVPYKTPSGFTFWWSPVFQRASREVVPCPWGGFLAEEMGCGKTVEILALILSNPAPPDVLSGSVLPDGYIVSRATLVVCAVSLVGQWMEEAKSKLNGSLRMYQYHGQGRNRDALTLATSYDLVVTTYQTLGSDWRMYNKKGSSTDRRFKPLGAIKWHRVVLDESHTVKAGGTQQTAACCGLKADRRWCCSGTPISTEVSEFVGQFKFLGCQPMDNKNYFAYHVKPAWSAGGWQTSGGAVNLLYALSRTLIRHTQQQRLGGATVCKLPEKTEEAIAVEFSETEQRLYLRVHKEARAEFQKYAMGGSMMISRNLLAIMSLLSPLRAICSGGLLRERDVRVPNMDKDEEVPKGADPNLVAPLEECSICLNLDMERPCRTPCLHWFCRECITAELAVREKCPLCRTELQVAQLMEGVSAAQGANEEGEAAAGSSAGSQAVVSESKLRALLKELAEMRERDPTAKALIFTQFNSTLEWLMARLTEEGYSYRTISGSMPLKKRSQAIDAFQRDPPTTVFLLSMRSGAVGINLTAANHVFILEPAMNPALEDQAVGRAFRMGQTRPVTVKKLYIKGSVEERIMEVVKDRREGRATGAAAAQTMYDEDTGRRVQKSKMRQQDVAGSIRMDRQELRMAELQLLFQDPDFTHAAGVNQAAAYNAAPAAPACGGSA